MHPGQRPGSGINPNAAPGPILATITPLVRQDNNVVQQWIGFEYSEDRVKKKMEYTIRCDVESVNVDNLSQEEFRTENCIYPRACRSEESVQYRDNRLGYETECNAVGWALAELNPPLRGKPGLIQRAVDSWRNRNDSRSISHNSMRAGFAPMAPLQSAISEMRAASVSGNLTRVQTLLNDWLSTCPPEEGIHRFRGVAYTAIENQHHEVTSYLLDKGVIPNMDLARLATQLKSIISLQLLLDHGWDINEPVARMELPALLQFAITDKDLTLWFLSHGANPNATCGIDITPLSIAMMNASFEVIKILFDHGGTIEHGQLLHYAARRQGPDRLEVIEFLLEKGADINAIKFQNDEWSYVFKQAFGLGTPLHDAAETGTLDVIQMLLEKGADRSIKSSRGDLAADVAERVGHLDVAKLLRSNPFSSSHAGSVL